MVADLPAATLGNPAQAAGPGAVRGGLTASAADVRFAPEPLPAQSAAPCPAGRSDRRAGAVSGGAALEKWFLVTGPQPEDAAYAAAVRRGQALLAGRLLAKKPGATATTPAAPQ